MTTVRHLSSGDLLRQEIRNQTAIGRAVAADMKAGKLIEDQTIFELIGKELSKPEYKRVMFDGFPRTIKQAQEVPVASSFAAQQDAEGQEPNLGRRHLPRCTG